MSNFREIREEVDRQYKVNSPMSAYFFVQGILWTAKKRKLLDEKDYFELDNYSHNRYKGRISMW